MEAAYKTGVLDPNVHDRLVADIDRWAREAGIPKELIWTPLAASCTDLEIEWVRAFHRHAKAGVYGLALMGGSRAEGAVEHMMGMVGALVRNFINAQVRTRQQVARALREGQALEATALAIPNLFVAGEEEGMDTKVLSDLYGLLLERMSQGKQTLVYVGDIDALGSRYQPLAGHIEKNFTLIPL